MTRRLPHTVALLFAALTLLATALPASGAAPLSGQTICSPRLSREVTASRQPAGRYLPGPS